MKSHKCGAMKFKDCVCPEALEFVAKMMKENVTGNCENDGCNGETCQSCCEHDDIDDGFCLICGADRTEDLINRACDYHEGDR